MSVPVAVLPPVPALLPGYAGLTDPVADLRAACAGALAWLAPRCTRLVVLGDPAPDGRGSLAHRVARALLADAGIGLAAVDAGQPGPLPDLAGAGLLVLANGSARRGEKAPGHLDDRAFAFDKTVAAALAGGEPEALAGLDPVLGADLLAAGVPALRALGALDPAAGPPEVRYDDDPFGVQYWVVTWTCGS